MESIRLCSYESSSGEKVIRIHRWIVRSILLFTFYRIIVQNYPGLAIRIKVRNRGES